MVLWSAANLFFEEAVDFHGVSPRPKWGEDLVEGGLCTQFKGTAGLGHQAAPSHAGNFKPEP